MPAPVGKGTGREIAIGHQNVPYSTSKKRGSKRSNRRSGRK